MTKVKRFFILIVIFCVPILSFIFVAQAKPSEVQQQKILTPNTISDTTASKPDSPWRTHANQNYVNAMVAEDEFVWIATYGGVVKWNTNDDSYIVFTPDDGLTNNQVNDMAIDGQGNKWFATTWGISKFDDTDWTTYSYANGPNLAINNVMSIDIDSLGNVWLGTWWNGVLRFDGIIWTQYTTADGLAENSVRSITVDNNDHIWVSTDGSGVSKFDGTTWTTYTKSDGLASNYMWTSAVDPEGNMWFGSEGGVNKFDGTTWITYTKTDGLADNDARSFAFDDLDNVWVGSYFGVNKFDGTNWTIYDESDGLAASLTSAIAIDQDNHKWFGSPWDGGISEFDDTNWIIHETVNINVPHEAYDIAFDSEGNKWFLSYNSIHQFYGENWHKISLNEFDVEPSSMAVDHLDNVWIGSDYGNDGLLKFDGTNWITYTTSDGLPSDNIRDITVDTSGDVWVATGSSLGQYNGSNWTTHSSIWGDVVEADQFGNVWAPASNGIQKFDGTDWTSFVSPESFSTISGIDFDPIGNVWIATEGSGAIYFDGTTWTRYDSDDGLDDYVYDIAVDEAGNVWTCGMLSVGRFDGVSWTHYSSGSGLANIEPRVVGVDHDGHKWFSFDYYGGISEYVEEINTAIPSTAATMIYTNTQNNSTIIQIPAGAVTTTTTLAYTPVKSVTEPEGFKFANHAFDLSASRNGVKLSELVFEQPITITIHYSDEDIAGLGESNMDLKYWNGTEWSTDGITLIEHDQEQNFIIFTSTHLSEFALYASEFNNHVYLPMIVK